MFFACFLIDEIDKPLEAADAVFLMEKSRGSSVAVKYRSLRTASSNRLFSECSAAFPIQNLRSFHVSYSPDDGHQLAMLEAADELTVDPADRIAVRRFDEGPGLTARVFTVALDDDDPAVPDRANDVHVYVAHIERCARRVGYTAALGGEGRRSAESGDKSDG